jgi:hypothetical protein
MTDSPQKHPEPPEGTNENRTIHTLHADGLSHADSLATPGGQSGKHTPTKTPNEMDQMGGAQELAKNSMNIRLTCSTQTVCACLADSPPGADRATRARVSQSQHLLSFAQSPESTNFFLPNHRWRWSVSRRCYTYEFVASNPLNQEESRFYWAHTKIYGLNWNPSIGGQIWSLRGQDQAHRCTIHLFMIPTKKSEPEHLKIKGTSYTRKSNKNSLKRHENHSSHKKEINTTLKAFIHSEVRISTKQWRKSKPKE